MKKITTVLLLVALLLLGSAGAALAKGKAPVDRGTGNQGVAEANQASWWSEQTGLECLKLDKGDDGFSDPFVLPEPHVLIDGLEAGDSNGPEWALVVINAGPPGDTRSTQFTSPVVGGSYVNARTGDVSNVILCWSEPGTPVVPIDETNTLVSSLDRWCVSETTWGFTVTITHIGSLVNKTARLLNHGDGALVAERILSPGTTSTITLGGLYGLPEVGPHYDLLLEQTVGNFEFDRSVSSTGVDFSACADEVVVNPPPPPTTEPPVVETPVVPQPVSETPTVEQPVEQPRLTSQEREVTPVKVTDELPATGDSLLTLFGAGLALLALGWYALRRA